MGLSRRKRKRGRKQAEKADLRGDRQIPHGGKGGQSGIWENATCSDLRLLSHAIRAGWPVPPERRGPILEEVVADLLTRDIQGGREARLALAGIRAILVAEQSNLQRSEIMHDLQFKEIIQDLQANGFSPRGIGRMLNRRGYQTGKGCKWDARHIRRVLAYPSQL